MTSFDERNYTVIWDSGHMSCPVRQTYPHEFIESKVSEYLDGSFYRIGCRPYGLTIDADDIRTATYDD